MYNTTPWKEANFISRTINNFYSGTGGNPSDLSRWPHSPPFFLNDSNKGRAVWVSPVNDSNKGGLWGSPPGITPVLKPIKNSGLILTDATANIGGNTISFYLNGINQVNAVEIDPLTCEILKHNLHIYELPTQNIYCQSYVDIYMLLDQDIVFLDPPWGGPDYKKSNNIDLYLDQSDGSSKNIIEICAELMEQKKVTLIVLKLPMNYNLPGLISRMPNKNFMTHKIYRKKHHSYNVVFCW